MRKPNREGAAVTPPPLAHPGLGVLFPVDLHERGLHLGRLAVGRGSDGRGAATAREVEQQPARERRRCRGVGVHERGDREG